MEHISVNINGRTEAEEGETVILEGTVEFCPSIQYIKWQMWHYAKFIDVNIHKSKYNGTKICLWNPKLVLNDVDQEDIGAYRIKVKSTTNEEYSNVHRIKILPRNEPIDIEVQPDQRNGRYYVGEDVVINARITNISKILCKTWQKETAETEKNIIDTSLERNIETENENGEYILTIRNCIESDSGTYFLRAACTNDMDVQSNKIQLNVVTDRPEVILSHPPKAVYDTRVIYKATIRSFINNTSTVWKRGEKIIDIINPKYKGSSNVGNCPVLCINNVSREDEDVYSIYVLNEWGYTELSYERLVVNGKEPVVSVKISDEFQSMVLGNTITLQAEIKSYPAPSCIRWTRIINDKEEIIEERGRFSIDVSDLTCPKLTIEALEFNDEGSYIIAVINDFGRVSANIDIKLEASQMIFISGPVVVSTDGVIRFQTQFTADQNCLNAKWLKCKRNTKKEITFGSTKYLIYNTSEEIKTQTFEIVDLGEDDTAEYQLSLDDLKSNHINTFIDDNGKFSTETQGNYFRYITLLSLCADALRKAFDKLPDTFEEKLKKFQEKSTSGDLLSLIKQNKPSSSKELDISLMCAMIRNLDYITKPKQGWGKKPKKNDITMADDVERIRRYRNSLCHDTSMEMETDVFNSRALELIWAIRRLSKNDVKLTEDICDAMNKIVTKGEIVEKMIVERQIIKEEVIKWRYIPLTVSELHGNTQTTKNEILFHQVHDSVISIRNNGALATHREQSDSGVCFTNRPLKVEEEVHMRGIHFCYGAEHHIFTKLGLTNIDPHTIRGTVDKKAAIGSALTPVQCCDYPKKRHEHWLEDFHLCISLLPNACLAISLNDAEQRIYDCQIGSTYFPLWLVIELDDKASIWISNV